MNKTLITSILTLALSACGGGGGETIVQDGTSNNNSVRSSTKSILPGSVCGFGGVEIASGIDENANGVLDAGEVDETVVVCNGDSGLDSLINITDEAIGINCPFSGVRIDSGLDKNRSGELDASEITSTSYVCSGASGVNGLDGASGVAGKDGLDGLDGADGKDGADSSSIASIDCFGGLEGSPLVRWGYTADQLNSGDITASGYVRNAEVQASSSVYFSALQIGVIEAPVFISYDLLDVSNYGYWKISLDRSTLIVTIEYFDDDLVNGYQAWTMEPEQCTFNQY